MIEHGLHLRRTEGEDPVGTLLYIHGLGESSHCLAGLPRHPGLRRWTHLVPDLAGYGDSPPSAEPPKLAEHAARLAQLLAAEHPDPVVVVGHSMGGVIGTILTEEAPERVRAFVNVEGNISGDDCKFSGAIAAYESDEDWLARGFGELVEKLAADPDPVIASYLVSVERCHPLTLYRNAGELVTASNEWGLAERLANLKRPVVFIYGEAAGGLSGGSLGLLRDYGIDRRPIAGAGHWPFLDRPDDFVSTARAFLDGLGTLLKADG